MWKKSKKQRKDHIRRARNGLVWVLLQRSFKFTNILCFIPHPWDSPGKNTGVGCHFLLQCMRVKSEREVAQSCPTPSDPMDCSPPGSSVHRICQARGLEWAAIAFSSGQAYVMPFPSIRVLSAMSSLGVRYSIFLGHLANICLIHLSLCSCFQLLCVPLLYCVAWKQHRTGSYSFLF